MFLVLIDFEWADLRDVFLRRETGVAAVSQHDDADDDENDAENSCRFHVSNKTGLERTAALDQINDQHHNRDDEQDMYNAAANMKAKSE
jgi:hypothetical protein